MEQNPTNRRFDGMGVIRTRQPKSRGTISRRFPDPFPKTNHARLINPIKTRQGLHPWLIFVITIISSLIALALGMIMLSIAFYAYYQYARLILPGVHVGRIKLDGMTLTQATLTLQEQMGAERTILVTNGSQKESLTLGELGITVDPSTTARRAYEVGHGATMVAELAMMVVSLKDGWSVNAEVEFDEQAAMIGIEKLLPAMSQPPTDATIRLHGNDLIAMPGRVGYTIDIAATIDKLRSDPGMVIESNVFQLIPQFIEPQISDATPALAEAQIFLDTPAVLQAYDPLSNESFQWPIQREQLATWLYVFSEDQELKVALDAAKVAEYLVSLSEELDQERYFDSDRYAKLAADSIRQNSQNPAPIPISHRPTSYLVQPGDTLLKIGWKLGFPFWMIIQANPGIDPDRLLAGTVLSIPSKDDLLPLPVIPNKRIRISISAQNIWIYQDGNLLGRYPISTGVDRSPTQPGIFQVQTHVPNAYASVWDLYMPNFLGIYEAWPGFMNGIHGLPTLSNGQRLWANILGRPASYGCIILDLETAKWLYGWAENGVVVEIQP